MLYVRGQVSDIIMTALLSQNNRLIIINKNFFPFIAEMSGIFSNFAIRNGELTPSRQKKNIFFCFALDFS